MKLRSDCDTGRELYFVFKTFYFFILIYLKVYHFRKDFI
jgi:hypothetical protein